MKKRIEANKEENAHPLGHPERDEVAARILMLNSGFENKDLEQFKRPEIIAFITVAENLLNNHLYNSEMYPSGFGERLVKIVTGDQAHDNLVAIRMALSKLKL